MYFEKCCSSHLQIILLSHAFNLGAIMEFVVLLSFTESSNHMNLLTAGLGENQFGKRGIKQKLDYLIPYAERPKPVLVVSPE